jgi:hemolysin III
MAISGTGMRTALETSRSNGFTRREQSRGEERANYISHALGLAAGLAGIPILISSAARERDLASTIGVAVFAAAIVLLYFTSAIYHGLQHGRAKRIFRVIEHSAIYLLIAGTYTPFTLGVLRGAWGWTLLGAIWILAATGTILKALNKASHPTLSTGLYLSMGWLIVIAAKPLIAGLPIQGLLLLVAGGLCYTVGVAFFVTDSRLRYGHFVWHLFVIAGTSCHYFAVLWYATS